MTNLSRERKGAKQKVRFFNDETGSIFFFGNFGDLFELTFSTNDVFQKKLNDVEWASVIDKDTVYISLHFLYSLRNLQ